jgi:hypothetical protein
MCGYDCPILCADNHSSTGTAVTTGVKASDQSTFQ